MNLICKLFDHSREHEYIALGKSYQRHIVTCKRCHYRIEMFYQRMYSISLGYCSSRSSGWIWVDMNPTQVHDNPRKMVTLVYHPNDFEGVEYVSPPNITYGSNMASRLKKELYDYGETGELPSVEILIK